MKVLVLGDTILDRYFYGDVKRISPEAPVPVLQYDYGKEVLGGACNVAANIRSLTKERCQIDYFGFGSQLIVDKLNEYGINFKGISAPKEKILQKIRYTSGDYQLLRMDKGLKYPRELILVGEKIIKGLDLESYDLIVISDYDKGTFTEDLAEYIFENFSKTILIDLKKYRSWIINLNLSNVIIKSNKKEWEDNNVYLLLQSNIRSAVKTLGAHGYSVLYPHSDPDKSKKDVVAGPERLPEGVVNVIGAGDTFLAGMAASYLDGRVSEIEMTNYANKAAAIKVRKSRDNVVSYKEIENAKF